MDQQKDKLKPSDIIIVIPIYKPALTWDEKLSLEQCARVLGAYPTAIVKPSHLKSDTLCAMYPHLLIEDFPDEYFTTIRGYNRLVLSPEFYRRFARYRYMLIYQLDAYIFRDELLAWCEKGYDYIGAAWLPKKKKYLTPLGRMYLQTCFRLFSRFWPEKLKREGGKHRDHKVSNHKYYKYQVGNGGFSLRRIDCFLRLTRECKQSFDRLLADSAPFYPEDLLLLLELERTGHRLRKPDYREALQFSFEENPAWAYGRNNHRLPFGCHGWSREPYYQFWKGIISSTENR